MLAEVGDGCVVGLFAVESGVDCPAAIPSVTAQNSAVPGNHFVSKALYPSGFHYSCDAPVTSIVRPVVWLDTLSLCALR